MVATEDGQKPIGGIEAGQLVHAFDFESGEWKLQKVLERVDSLFDAPVIQVETENRHSITCTAYHPFWVISGRDLDERAQPRELQEGEDEGKALPAAGFNRMNFALATRCSEKCISRLENINDGRIPIVK